MALFTLIRNFNHHFTDPLDPSFKITWAVQIPNLIFN